MNGFIVMKNIKYCPKIFATKRLKTRQVQIGSIGIGGKNPIRIQSMTTSDTKDVDATIAQIMRLADAGCEIVRLTVQGKKEAQSCEQIKNGLIQKGYTVPLVADIHFYPPAAMMVVDFVEKVRINPGNFLDKRATFKVLEYTDETYALELKRIEESFSPLILKCKQLKRAIRIGTNHGSLSDRIMNRYGDTPRGMVESAFEYARICRKYDFHDFIFSMKASNPQIMIQAYRLLVMEMIQCGWDYPLHLGVTEAGEGEDGRIKSAIGIGSLLLDGLGDTLRVSLTEDPWNEIDPCRRLIQFADIYRSFKERPFHEKHRDITQIVKKTTTQSREFSLHPDGSVGLYITEKDVESPHFFTDIGCKIPLQKGGSAVDILLIDKISADTKLHSVLDAGIQCLTREKQEFPYLIELKDFVVPSDLPLSIAKTKVIRVTDEKGWEKLLKSMPHCIFLAPKEDRVHFCRKFCDWAKEKQITCPILLNFSYDCVWEDFLIQASVECGSLLCDHLADGVLLTGPYPLKDLHEFSLNLLQGCRMRTTKTEFISCPGCGRTLFNLQKVSEEIRKKTQHLPGVKIAIMGCIVNGPGEMADADFGYVGSRPGKIDLYVGKVCLERNIPHEEAPDKLIQLIKEHGKWIDIENVPLLV